MIDAKHTAGEALRNAVFRLTEAGIDDARTSATWLVCGALGITRSALLAHPERPLSAADRALLGSWLDRRLRREPLQYILGNTPFMNLDLKVDPRALIPRPETEQVVTHALRLMERSHGFRGLDIGTGSGCIALALAYYRRDATISACDVSADALALARENAIRNDVRVTFIQMDILDGAQVDRLPGGLDLVISNPPYVPPAEAATMQPEVRNFEPSLALFSSSDPLQFYRVITCLALDRLIEGGSLVFETHSDYARDVAALVQGAGFKNVETAQDYAGLDRIVSAAR